MVTAVAHQAAAEAMTRVLTVAQAVIQPAALASISMRRWEDGAFYTPWASHTSAREIDALQYELGGGPCVEAARSGSMAHVVLDGGSSVWPELAEKVAPYGVGAVLSTPVRLDGDALGALNLYSRHREPFDGDSCTFARHFADLASAVLAQTAALPAPQLAEARRSREVIGLALGVLMAWQGGDRDDAFATLRRTAVRDERDLVEVARDVLGAAAPPIPMVPLNDSRDRIHAINERFAEMGFVQLPDRADTDRAADAVGPTVDDVRLLAHLGQVIPRLLAASARIEPDALAGLVLEEGRLAGLEEVVILLVDHEQQVLNPLPPAPDQTSLRIEGTMAGRAFQSEVPVTSYRPDGHWLVWLPLLDGADRLGVLQVRSPFLSDELLRRIREISSVVAGLVVSKSQYGDALHLARRRQDMTLTAELRWALLPPLTFDGDRVGIACMLEPAYDLAGDAFDYAINDGVLHVAIFDAMGHGLEATQLANLALGAYRYSRRLGMDLHSTFRTIDRVLIERFGGDSFVTAQLVILDAVEGRLRWLNAGHPHPLVLRRGRLANELASDPSLPMGLGFEPETANEVSLEPGDHLLFFTDGIVEAHSPGGEPFGKERLIDLTVRALADQQTLAETARRLVRSVRLHRDGPLEDDATLLLVAWDHPRWAGPV